MKVSVIIPVYNAENCVSNCIKNCKNQTFNDFEVIFIDDCSKDKTTEIISEEIKNDGRFSLITLQKNQRQGYARNIGLEQAKGDYVMFFDVDDDYSLDLIEKMYNKISSDNADMTACKFCLVDEKSGETIENTDFAMLADYPKNLHNGFSYSDITPIIDLFNKSNTIWDKIFHRNFLLENNIKFPTNLFNKEDDVFAFRTLFSAKKITILNEFLYFYKINPEKYNSNFQKQSIYDCFLMFDLIRKDLQEYGLLEKFHLDFIKYEIFTLKYYYGMLEQNCHEDFFYKLQNSYKKYENFAQEIKNSDNVLYELITKVLETKEFSTDIDNFLKNY